AVPGVRGPAVLAGRGPGPGLAVHRPGPGVRLHRPGPVRAPRRQGPPRRSGGAGSRPAGTGRLRHPLGSGAVKAVIMAGGEGSPLRPLTSHTPKPMLPLANRPMMEHIVGLLREHGFTEIVVTVAFLANQIRTYFDDGSDFGVEMVYATEEQPLGTAGSVRN